MVVADEILEPSPINWRRLLASEIRGALKRSGQYDYTYARPNRRQVPGVVLPTLRSPHVEAAVVIDTSGSMTTEDLKAALSDTKALLNQAGSYQCKFVACDALATRAVAITDVKQAARRLKGGGGTDMRIGIDAAIKPHRGTKPNIVVVMTDGYTPWHETSPDRSVTVIAVVPTGLPDRFTPPSWMRTVLRDRRAD